MKISPILHTALLALAALLLTPAAQAGDYKIGVVNPAKVLEDAPQADTARKRLQKEFSQRQKDLVSKQKEIKKLQDKLAKDGAIMSESNRKKLERDIIAKRRELKRLQDEFRDDLNFRRNEEFGKIQKEVVKAIQAVAREGKYDLIIGDGVIFASKKVDITPLVVEKLKAGGKKK